MAIYKDLEFYNFFYLFLSLKMETWRQNSSIVSRLRLWGNYGDVLGARLRFERLFSAANFHPVGVPPTAIVCIKKLHALALERRFGSQDFQLSLDWQTGVQSEIEKLYRRAFRPIRESVPAQAESIVFADNAELLACLASDWCEGILAERWWWRSLFPHLQQTQTIARIWFKAAEFSPTALQILTKQRKVVKFVKKLQPAETNNLLRRMISVFGLIHLHKALFEPIEAKKKFDKSPSKNLIKESDLSFRTFFTKTEQAILSFQQQCFLGIGLMLARAPRVARSAEFARQVKTFRTEFEISRKIAEQSKTLKQTKKSKAKEKQEIQKIYFSEDNTEKLPNVSKSKIGKQKPSEKKIVETTKTELDFAEESIKPSAFAEVLKTEIPTAQKAEITPGKIVFEDLQSKDEYLETKNKPKFTQTKKPAIFKTAVQEIIEETETEFEFIIETRFGGVFYLLNLGLYLHLYRDFTESLETEIDLNIWDFVALLGFEFLGEKIKNDAVWKFLERLAGRENDDELGQEFNAPDEWRISPDWLETFPTNQKWRWMKTEKRLIIRHPDKFSIVDIRLVEDFQSQLETELQVYQKNISEVVESNVKDLSPSANWLQNLTEYLQRRLLQALNLTTREEINQILFERKAKVSVTATHLDITFSLADLPIAVRLSGLDRNPAWIPAAGKFVNFHFE